MANHPLAWTLGLLSLAGAAVSVPIWMYSEFAVATDVRRAHGTLTQMHQHDHADVLLRVTESDIEYLEDLNSVAPLNPGKARRLEKLYEDIGKYEEEKVALHRKIMEQ